MLPIYTQFFTGADFGIIEMLAVLSSFMGAILVTRMDSAQSMYFSNYKEEGTAVEPWAVFAIPQRCLPCGSSIVLATTPLS